MNQTKQKTKKTSIFQPFFGSGEISEKSSGFNIFPAFAKRVLHTIARYVPLMPTWRASIHRWRGVKMGKNVFVGAEVYIDDSDPDLVTIEDDVAIAAQTTIMGHVRYSMHFAEVFVPKEGVLIKRGAHLGQRCMILAGVTVGEYSAVGAGSVVTKDVPAYSVVAGVPAKVIKTFTREELKLP